MSDLTQVQFDYGQIAEQHRDEVKGAAMRIKVRMARTAEDIIHIGYDLKVAKEKVGHGKWLDWLDVEFGMGKDTAARFMRVADKVGDQNSQFAKFSPSALYELTSPSTDGEVVDVALSRAEQGDAPSHKEIKELKRQIAEQKERADEEKSKAKGAHQELQELRNQLNEVRDEKDTLEREMQRGDAPRGVQQQRINSQDDQDLADEAANKVAEIIAEHVPGEHWDGLKANLYSTSTKKIAQALNRLTGVSVFDSSSAGRAAE